MAGDSNEGGVERVTYDEFGLFNENAEEYGLPFDGPPIVRREAVPLGDGRALSALIWGDSPAEIVFLHGGAQNAHTWDTVVMALGRPVVCIDLPGHGHSDGPRTGSGVLNENAADVATAIRTLAPHALAVVGMSLGGMTTMALAAHAPDLVRRMVLVDVTPGVNAKKAEQIIAFVNGPESFDSFDDLLARTIEFNPTRTVASLRRGILHNALQREDGSWVWRYARHRAEERAAAEAADSSEGALPRVPDAAGLWDAIEASSVPLLLCRGMRTQSVVDDDDEAELLRRRPDAKVVRFPDAGHSIQGDQPVELAATIDEFIGTPGK